MKKKSEWIERKVFVLRKEKSSDPRPSYGKLSGLSFPFERKENAPKKNSGYCSYKPLDILSYTVSV